MRARNSGSDDMQDLAGTWTLADVQGDHRIAFTVPGDGINALHAAGAIPDPYWGRNEYDLRWICGRDWVARRRFEVARTDLVLVVSMLDTVAEIAVNGVTVHRSDSMFRSWRIDLSGVLRLGANEIAITFRSSEIEAARRQAGSSGASGQPAAAARAAPGAGAGATAGKQQQGAGTPTRTQQQQQQPPPQRAQSAQSKVRCLANECATSYSGRPASQHVDAGSWVRVFVCRRSRQ